MPTKNDNKKTSSEPTQELPEAQQQALNTQIATQGQSVSRTPWQEGKHWFIIVDSQKHMFPSFTKAIRAFRLLMDAKINQLQFDFQQLKATTQNESK